MNITSNLTSKACKLLRNFITGAFLLSATGMVQAASITLNPLDSIVNNGAIFDVTVVGRDFNVGSGGTLGGGVSLFWDPNILSLNGYNPVFSGDQIFGQAGIIDNVVGSLTDLSVTSLVGTVLTDFDVAVLTFTALNVGFTPVDVAIGLFPLGSPMIWVDSDGFVDVDPEFIGGSVTVLATSAIPVPGAVWLFGSGLLSLIGFARTRQAVPFV